MRSEGKELHQSSTLPSFSDANLLPAGVRKAGDEVKAVLCRRRKAHQNSGPDQESKAWRRTQLEQRHLEAYMNMHRLRDALYRRYTSLLKDKVHSQRLQLQQRAEAARAKSEREPEQRQKKLAFSKLQRNDSYLESLPKTSYYLIFDLQTQLSVCGHLKTHQDLEDFHSCIRYNSPPSQLQRSLQDVRKKILGRRSATGQMIPVKTSEKHLCTDDDGGYGDHTSHSRLLEQESGAGKSSAELIFSGSQEKNENQQMFLKMKAPTFATLQPNLMRNFQSKMPDLVIPEIPVKSRKAEIYVRHLRQMYDLSVTNMAFSQRLLDRETDSLCWQEERDVQDLVLPAIESKQGDESRTHQPPPKQPRSVQTHQTPCPQSLSRMPSVSHRSFDTPVLDTVAVSRCKTPDPLSIEDLCHQVFCRYRTS